MNVHERLFKQKAMINKMILDKVRDPYKVADKLQKLVRVPVEDSNVYQRLSNLWFAIFGVSDTEEKIRELSRVLQLIIDEPDDVESCLRVGRLGATNGPDDHETVKNFLSWI